MYSFSIVTITFNSEKYLEETLESIHGQGYPQLEHLIVDGGSTDRTREICESYGERTLWESGPDKGIADAMNKGIERARGDIVAHLHSDDLYVPGTLEKVARMFEKNPGAKWLYGNGIFIDGEGETVKKVYLKPYNYKRLRSINGIIHPSVFIKREVFDEVGLFDVSLKYVMDYDLWVRIGSRYSPLQTEAFLSKFRIHEGSLSSQDHIKAFDEEYALRLKNYSDEFPANRFFDYWRYKILRGIKRYTRY